MSSRLTNLLLLLLVAAGVATGILGWLLPEPKSLPLYHLHRVLGLALVLLLVWKQVIVRASIARRLGRQPRDGSTLVGIAAGSALLASLALGLAWTLDLVSFDSFWGYSALNLHVLLALATLPFMVRHLLRRWERRPAARELVTRRSALQLLALSAASLASWQLTERVANAWALAGARRTSGSKHAGSFSGNDFPVTIWLFDSVPSLDASTWHLQVVGNTTTPISFSYADLLAYHRRELTAVLDCTGGWWSEQVWSGASVGDVLAAGGIDPNARLIDVVSVTGHRWTFAVEELRAALLATHVGGEPLSPGHGYPVRLVMPGRRGFQWVKWVDRLEVL
jgi:DMSO/TMAO reductase YedYZ molybdopterin-dependent catalytic subunit